MIVETVKSEKSKKKVKELVFCFVMIFSGSASVSHNNSVIRWWLVIVKYKEPNETRWRQCNGQHWNWSLTHLEDIHSWCQGRRKVCLNCVFPSPEIFLLLGFYLWGARCVNILKSLGKSQYGIQSWIIIRQTSAFLEKYPSSTFQETIFLTN